MMPLLRSFPVKLCFVSGGVCVCFSVCRTEGQLLPGVVLKSLLPCQAALKRGEHLWFIFSPLGESKLCFTLIVGESLVPAKGTSLLFLPCNTRAACSFSTLPSTFPKGVQEALSG